MKRRDIGYPLAASLEQQVSFLLRHRPESHQETVHNANGVGIFQIIEPLSRTRLTQNETDARSYME
jgi:hypothetical protein